MEQLDQLIALIGARECADIERLDAAHAVWDISTPGLFARRRPERIRRVEQCRLAILYTLLRGGSPAFIRHAESPDGFEVPGSWSASGERTWIVPEGFSVEDRTTAAWLALGDWLLSCGRSALTVERDIFRLDAPQIVEAMREDGVTLAVASFHDDVSWRVAVTSG